MDAGTVVAIIAGVLALTFAFASGFAYSTHIAVSMATLTYVDGSGSMMPYRDEVRQAVHPRIGPVFIVDHNGIRGIDTLDQLGGTLDLQTMIDHACGAKAIFITDGGHEIDMQVRGLTSLPDNFRIVTVTP